MDLSAGRMGKGKGAAVRAAPLPHSSKFRACVPRLLTLEIAAPDHVEAFDRALRVLVRQVRTEGQDLEVAADVLPPGLTPVHLADEADVGGEDPGTDLVPRERRPALFPAHDDV